MVRRPTLVDIANAAGVSPMTVSRAINNKPGVSDDVRQEILKLVEQMGYRPNQIARSLATSHTGMVGLVVPDNTNPFFAQIARGVEDAAFENNYNIFLLNTNEEPDRELSALDSLWQKDIDGIILGSSRLRVEALNEQIRRFPAMVLLNRDIAEPQSHLITINVNDQHGGLNAVSHFLRLGRRTIAYIGGPVASVSNQRRLEGYRLGLKNAELPFDPGLVENTVPNTEGGREAMAALLTRRPQIDAVFAFNDLVAVGAVQICLEAGKPVPQDIAVIGVDDIPLATIFRPQLTSLHVNLRQIGKLAMRTLLDIITGDGSPTSIYVEPELYLRDSA